ncbi:MAG TPA: hypothetical protein VF138_10665 [Caulobacteraceae bacterium]
MTPATAYRLAGIGAILGGLLRLLSPFGTGLLDANGHHLLWLATDILLLFGLVGIYGYSRKMLGLTGLVGFALAAIGLLIVRSAGDVVFGPRTYAYGAVIWTVGMAVLAFPMLLRGVGHTIAAAMWMLALIVGVFSVLRPGQSWGVLTAAVLFSLGYIAAGLPLFRKPREDKL